MVLDLTSTHSVNTGSHLRTYHLKTLINENRSDGTVFINKFNRLAVKDLQNDTEMGEVPTENFQNDSFYLCPVTIGGGAKTTTVNLDFDTGSSDLWGRISNDISDCSFLHTFAGLCF